MICGVPALRKPFWLIPCIALLLWCIPAFAQQQFKSADDAVDALVTAARAGDPNAILEVLGPDGRDIVSSGDKVADRTTREQFAAAYDAKHTLTPEGGAKAILVIGEDDWPFPIPIVRKDDKWSFDTKAGLDEILRRRIGRNELDAIQVCHGYVEAQRQYALTRHDGAVVNQYAQRVISTPGKQDGLAWRTGDGKWGGPVGEEIAGAIAEGYKDRYQPYHGYYFKILKGQGPAAPMGRMDFVLDSAMIGGFALVAAPAEYLVTGVNTFIVSHSGIVYEKDLGDQTLEAFRAMDRYNPDSTWKAVPGQ